MKIEMVMNSLAGGGTLQGVLFASLVFALAGCSSTSHRKNDIAAVSTQTAAAEVQAESQAIELAVTSLKELVVDPGPDLRRPYKHFSQCLDRLIACAERTAARGRAMDQRHEAYFQAWDKDLNAIDYDHVREVSVARKTEVTNRFDALSRRYRESQEVVQPLIAYLEDLRHALNADLTREGVAALKDVTQNAESNALKVQGALSALTAALNESSVRLSSVPPSGRSVPVRQGAAPPEENPRP